MYCENVSAKPLRGRDRTQSRVFDQNGRKLRGLLVDAIKKDPLDYLNDPVPIAWLNVFDKLLKVREGEPIIKIYSSDGEPSVIALMRDVGALRDCENDLSKCKARAQAMLQLFDIRGAVVRSHCCLFNQNT